RHGVRRLHRGRRDPGHLEADAARPPLRASLHGAGAARRADRRHARGARRGARRRRPARGCAPLHADARRGRGGLAHRDDVLARPLRRGRRPAARVSRRDPVSLELLWELPAQPTGELPDALEAFYGGGLALSDECLYANFVETLDALVADESDDDKHLMGLLRALADVVLIGTGTLLASPKGRWRPEGVYPAGK